MAKTCVTEKTADRQRWIENGLLEMMLQTKYSKIRVTDLCEHLDLSRRSFYRYFDDLDDVLNSLLDHTFQHLALAPMEPTVEYLQRGYEFWLDQKDLLNALSHGGLIEKMYEFTMRYTNFVDGTDEEKDAQIFIIGGFISLMLSWYAEGFQKTPEEMARFSHKILYEPYLKP